MAVLEKILNDYKNGVSLEKICKKYGGTCLYIPKVSPRAQEGILRDFNGYNIEFLSHKYNLSERTVRAIVKKSLDKEEE